MWKMKKRTCSDCHAELLDTEDYRKLCWRCVNNKRRYRLSHKAYQELYEKQNGCCAICNNHRPAKGQGGLYVDHNHSTGKIRGLLCPICNDVVGKFESPIWVIKVNNYLTGDVVSPRNDTGRHTDTPTITDLEIY